MPKAAASAPTSLELATVSIIDGVRDQRGITRADLARRAAMPRTTLTEMLDGKVPMRMGQLFAVCAALGLSPSTVLAAAEVQVDQNAQR